MLRNAAWWFPTRRSGGWCGKCHALLRTRPHHLAQCPTGIGSKQAVPS
jgi:hypothetical protein